ncbi:ankyrin repeat and sterile alpha motif domain-containing protein 1B isoform X2 [Sphaeramia orbicularis]|uniref:ankyrin repeat and sterile alpha motif domain-containing protein 1B isoform X2 n=1 Tax=Sphaeramia orbicularis TaxID=375764 RepID=UPI00117F217F|nr:ankyrin repeat and sterile alpha motif domain-containing protein 1B isoform X2 [Sphaeramia orbicularis]
MGKEQELLEAARTGNVALVEKLLSGKKGILGSSSGSIPLPNLLSMWKGLNVNCTDSSGYTPLHHASLNGHREVVLKLLQFEASTNVADSKGCFPLHLAAWRGDVDIVRILIHHGPSHCRVNQQNHERETALHCAAQYGHSDVVSVLLQELTDPTMRNSRQETPLDLAALYGRLQVVCMLVSAHPNLMTSHTRRHTPLHLAARNGHHSTVQTLLEAGMDVNCVTENGSALHEAALFGKMDVVRLLLDSGIDTNLRDSQGRTALEILREHPAPKSQQITALIQEYMMDEMERKTIMEEPVRKCPIPAPRTSVPSPSASPSLRHKNDAVTSELSKLLHEIKKCRDRDYSFEELCQTISSHSMDSFGSGRLSDEERPDRPNGTLTRGGKRPTPPLAPAQEEDEADKICGPTGFWEALTPCNGCHNLGFSSLSQDSKRSAELVTSPSLDVFLPEDEDNPYESVTTAVTRKPCSLDINHRLNACPRNGHLSHVAVNEGEQSNHGNCSTGPTPDCSPPSPDTALKNIERVIRPQPKQRTSLSSSLDVQRPVNHSCEPSEVSSSLGYASFSTSPPASPPLSPNQEDSAGSNDDCQFTDEGSYQRDPPPPPCTSSTSSTVLEDRRKSHIPEEFAGLLHGSSPACETPDTPYHLYSHKARKYGSTDIQSTLLQTPEFSIVIGGGPTQIFSRTERDSSAQRTTNDPQKPQVVYRTIFHTRVNQDQARPRNCAQVDPPPRGWATLDRPPSYSSASSSGQNGEATELLTGSTGKDSSSGTGYEERACTLGRMRSMPRSVLDLQLSKSLSKSDSNLVAVSPIQEEHSWGSGSRGQGPGSPSPGEGSTPGGRLERTPSFTAEWEEIDKIMSSIGAGIGSGLDIKEDTSGPRCPLQSVGQWLDSIGLVQYENHLLANGFDNVQFMGSNVVEDQDLLEIGILNSAHRQRLLQAIRLLPRVRPVGYDGNNPTSVAEWLESLELGDYTKSFLINGYTSMELVKKIWEIELINVLKISLIGHRKRILASLGDRLHEDIPQKPPRAISLRSFLVSQEPGGNHTPPQLSPSVGQAAYTAGVPGGSLDVQHLIMQADARRRQRSNDNYFEDVPRSKLERQMAQVSMAGEWCEPITLRPPNEATSSTPVQYWQHHPEKLIFQSCDYEAYYLGSMLVKELRGTESTQDACAKMRSTEQMKKVPTIVLSVSYKGVKFIDATNKNIIAEHEIRNISCAAQDPEDLSTFAYITKDLKSSHHYCHVFTAFDVNLAYEIILTLGQAFEVAYQLALQARKSGHGSSTLPESFDSKPSKPVPKPRVNIRKTMDQPSMDQKGHANVPWIVEPGQEAKRGVNTKAMPDAHVYYCGMQRM